MSRDKEIHRSARTLFDVAVARGDADRVCEDLGGVRDAIAATPELAAALADYTIHDDTRLALLEALFRTGVCPLTMEFLRRMESRKLNGALPQLAAVFETFHEKLKGRLRVHVASASPLPGALGAQLTARLAEMYRMDVRATWEVAPPLLAGFRIRAGDIVHDFSAAAQLRQIQRVWAGQS